MQRNFDPFPLADRRDQRGTTAVNWEGIAARLVHDVLRVEPHERVLFSADPYFGAAALDAMRAEVQRARAIELATILHWTPQLNTLRLPNGRRADADGDRAECEAMRQLFEIADVFILLMNDRRDPRRTLAGGQIEPIVEHWRGRAVHLHWFHDPMNPDPEHAVNRALDRLYERAILEVDHGELGRRMNELHRRMVGAELCLTDARGSELYFRAPAHAHLNYGDASRPRMATMVAGRDREEEMPAGMLRIIPEPESARGILKMPVRADGESPHLGRGFDCDPFARDGLAFHFRDGRVESLRTGGDQAALDALWAAETGDKDRFGELVLGCNPMLRRVPGSTFEPQYGAGAGVIRLILGDNVLSGGRYVSSFHRWLMLSDASLHLGSETIVRDGQLVFN
ncbi:MAG: hypothetical protein AB7L76_04385 [Burkholderiaceae bacterium]